MANIPEGFNSWHFDVQLTYLEAQKAASEAQKAASEAQQAIAASDAQKAASEAQKAASEAQQAIAASEAQKAAYEAKKMEFAFNLESAKAKRTSIGKADAVFLFFLDHGGRHEVSGTAFAISDSLVLTAYHNFTLSQGGCHSNCAISSKASKVGGFLVPSGDCIALELLSFDEFQDWALFRRRSEGVFSTTLQICPQDELPNPSSDVVVQQYYYSIGLILNSSITDLCIWSDTSRLLQYDESRFAILMRGKTSGSSGSPAVTSDGKVFGMHLDSFNEAGVDASGTNNDLVPIPPAPLAKKSRHRPYAEVGAEFSAEMECTSELTGLSDLSHASYSRCLVLAFVPQLMEAVRRATGGHAGGELEGGI